MLHLLHYQTYATKTNRLIINILSQKQYTKLFKIGQFRSRMDSVTGALPVAFYANISAKRVDKKIPVVQS